VRAECHKWAAKGIDIRYENRDNRRGYKAGALKEGLRKPYVRECEHVAIFDADFQPDPDFLERTVPFLVHNPELALVQARWKFGKQKKKKNPPPSIDSVGFSLFLGSDR
jgi:beta-mannan synthase